MNKHLIDFRVFHSAGYGDRTRVRFNRNNRGQKQYIPTATSLKRLYQWMREHHTEYWACEYFETHIVKIEIKLKRSERIWR